VAEPVLALSNVEKIFGGLRAVGGVSLEVRPGQIFGLIGPNGAGKTTIFNCVTGVYVPERGEVRFLGRSIVGHKPHQIALAGIGRTFQNIRLFGDMTVAENVMVAAHHTQSSGFWGAMLRTRRWSEEERALRKKAEELLEIFELRDDAEDEARNLPYGSQRRLEIARALMLQPKLILLDEPAAGMNSREADKLKDQIRWLRDRFELTIVLVEHNMQVVMGVCEHVHCVDHGETIASGSPVQVQNDPHVLAAYLGTEGEEEGRPSLEMVARMEAESGETPLSARSGQTPVIAGVETRADAAGREDQGGGEDQGEGESQGESERQGESESEDDGDSDSDSDDEDEGGSDDDEPGAAR